MSAPQVIFIPPLAGVGQNVPIQIPAVDSGSPTLVNTSQLLSLTLCNDSTFNATWTLAAGESLPLPNGNSVMVQNQNSTGVNILVIDGVVPVQVGAQANYGGLSAAIEGLGGGAAQPILPAPPPGYAYRLQNLSAFYYTSDALSFYVNIFVEGLINNPSIYFYANNTPGGTYFLGDTYSFNGQLANGPIFVTVENISMNLTITYDLVPL